MYGRRADSLGLPAASFLLGQLCEMGLLGVDMGMGMGMDAPVVAAQKMLALYHYKTAAQQGHDVAALCAGQETLTSIVSILECNRMFVKMFCTHSDCSISVCMYVCIYHI